MYPFKRKSINGNDFNAFMEDIDVPNGKYHILVL